MNPTHSIPNPPIENKPPKTISELNAERPALADAMNVLHGPWLQAYQRHQAAQRALNVAAAKLDAISSEYEQAKTAYETNLQEVIERRAAGEEWDQPEPCETADPELLNWDMISEDNAALIAAYEGQDR